ncbi:hypothetical protein [Massilia sp. erpn]|uniref:hypothetical protein n=1 Tax=Massilia sp. erpn TaxID=2738142 RepID=UPI002103E4A1|nr:hypothetical protein [Massilia sp. erpn]UTY59237.1 hypothetical protein HPQ68_19885 [Massilia sp. erpn]
MRYPGEQEVRLGDRVKLSDGAEGVVVCSIDTDEYLPEYPKSDWDYLKHGVMLKFPKYGLIHYTQPEAEMTLVERASIT